MAWLGILIGAIGGAWLRTDLWLLCAIAGGLIGRWMGETRARLAALEQRLATLEREHAAASAQSASTPTAVVDERAMPVATPWPEPASTTELAADTPPPETPVPEAVAPASEPTPSPASPIVLPKWLQRIAQGNPLAKIGIVLLFFGVASGLRLLSDYGLFPISVRLLLASLAGIGLIGFGVHKVRDEVQRTFGLTIQGGGFGLLYLVAYFALQRYALLGPELAFACFGLLGIACVVLATRQDGPALATLGLAGAFLAPVLAGGHADTPLGLFSYFALLNGLILLVDWFKAWRVLNLVGFVLTLLIGMGWALEAYEPRHYAVTQAFSLLFLLIYSGMPVLTAVRRAPGWSGWQQGSLLFGTPIAGLGIQAAISQTDTAAAWSALAGALWYLLLWAWLRRTDDERNALLVRSHLGIAIALFTVAIPLAFDPDITSALWALEGAAVLWYGIGAGRRLPQVCGLLMQLAGGVALLDAHTLPSLPVWNDSVRGALLLVLAGGFSARSLRQAGAAALVWPGLPMGWALCWWLGMGLGEIHRFAPDARQMPFDLLFLAATTGLLELLAARWHWPALRGGRYLLLAGMWGTALIATLERQHPLAGLMALILPVALLAHYALLRRAPTPGGRLALPVLHLGAYWLLAVVAMLELSWLAARHIPGAGLWAFMALSWPLTLVLLLPPLSAGKQLWPFGVPEARYLPLGVAPLLLGLWLLLAWACFSLSGSGTALPYLPVFNAFDLSQLAGMAVMGLLLRNSALAGRRFLGTALAGLAFVWLSTLAARIAHAWGGVSFALVPMLDAALFQALLTLFWTTLAIAAMIVAARQVRRPLWYGGAVLLGIVGAKLLLYDLSGRGTLIWTATLIGVAVLVLAAGYFAPLPPRAGAQNQP